MGRDFHIVPLAQRFNGKATKPRMGYTLVMWGGTVAAVGRLA